MQSVKVYIRRMNTQRPKLICTREQCFDPHCDRLHIVGTCEICGEAVEALLPVPNCDPPLYHGTGNVCLPCAETYKNNCGSCR